jgi:predicted DNA-binding ribbon-helix-helix protein
MKRTTLVLEDACFEAVRDLARREGRQLSQVVNELLADGLVRRRRRKRKADFRLPAFSMGRPRVNLADRNALEALMDS